MLTIRINLPDDRATCAAALLEDLRGMQGVDFEKRLDTRLHLANIRSMTTFEPALECQQTTLTALFAYSYPVPEEYPPELLRALHPGGEWLQIYLMPLTEHETGAVLTWDKRVDQVVRALVDRIGVRYPDLRRGLERAYREAVLRYHEADAAPADDRGVTKPEQPARPPAGSRLGLGAWFDWYHAMKDSGFRVTLKDVAAGSGYDADYVKQKHAEWLAERKG